VASNRGFWKVVVAMAAGGILLIVLVFVSRPFARSGAVAYAQANLRAAADAAQQVAEIDGSLADATALCGWAVHARSTTSCSSIPTPPRTSPTS
jgi:hypothetical protein